MQHTMKGLGHICVKLVRGLVEACFVTQDLSIRHDSYHIIAIWRKMSFLSIENASDLYWEHRKYCALHLANNFSSKS